MNTLPTRLEAERSAVAATLAELQDQLYKAGRDGRSNQEIELLRGEVIAALDRREALDRLIGTRCSEEQSPEAES
jgi:hypothetical protein